MIYYKVMTGISLASFTRILLALDSAGKNYCIHHCWSEDNKPEMRIIPLEASKGARAEYIDRIAESRNRKELDKGGGRMTEMIEEPLRELIVTVAAWRRLISKAEELAASKDTKFAGLYILHKMKECMTEAERDMKENEEKMEKMVE